MCFTCVYLLVWGWKVYIISNQENQDSIENQKSVSNSGTETRHGKQKQNKKHQKEHKVIKIIHTK